MDDEGNKRKIKYAFLKIAIYVEKLELQWGGSVEGLAEGFPREVVYQYGTIPEDIG